MSPRTAHLGKGLCKCRGDELVHEFGSILILLIDFAAIIPDNKAGMIILELSVKSSKTEYTLSFALVLLLYLGRRPHPLT
jgi:hypothetical protein